MATRPCGYPELRGYESMSLAACLLSSSEKLTIGGSIANIYARNSFTAQRAMVSLNALYGGRFILGLGVSHIPIIEGVYAAIATRNRWRR